MKKFYAREAIFASENPPCAFAETQRCRASCDNIVERRCRFNWLLIYSKLFAENIYSNQCTAIKKVITIRAKTIPKLLLHFSASTGGRPIEKNNVEENLSLFIWLKTRQLPLLKKIHSRSIGFWPPFCECI